jgi:uncharacterized protein (UPF0297 family)
MGKKPSNIDKLFLETIESNDLPKIRDCIYQGADVTIAGNFALSYAIKEKNDKLAQLLLEERFNIIKNSNPILTVVGSFVAKNPQIIAKITHYLQTPKILIHCIYHCIPKERGLTSKSLDNQDIIDAIISKSTLDVLKKSKIELTELVALSTNPRYTKVLDVVSNSIEKIKREKIMNELSSSPEPTKQNKSKNRNDKTLCI